MRTTPYDHGGLGVALITYLHARGVVGDPMANQGDAHGAPGVYLGLMEDSPDRAIGVFNIRPHDDDTSLPTVRFMIAIRGARGDQLGVVEDAQDILDALHSPSPLDLTATTRVAYCQRVAVDPPLMPDTGGRFVRVDTYQTRVYTPSTTTRNPNVF